MADLKLPLIWEFETVDVSFTHIPKDPKEPYVHYILHTYRDNKGAFQLMDVMPKLGKDLVFDCLSLHWWVLVHCQGVVWSVQKVIACLPVCIDLILSVSMNQSCMNP